MKTLVLATVLTLTAADGVEIHGAFEEAPDANGAVVLLFHQAGSNHHEYDPIAPLLNEWGFDTLAIDQRSGAKRWGHSNKTVDGVGKSSGYLTALPDLQAALDWAKKKKYERVICVGSSYSAALVFVLAQNNPDAVSAIASFSPGEYFDTKDLIRTAASEVAVPVYVTAASTPKEESRIDTVLSRSKSKKVTRQRAKTGVHGASTLRKDRNGKGYKAEREAFRAFLVSVLKKSS